MGRSKNVKCNSRGTESILIRHEILRAYIKRTLRWALYIFSQYIQAKPAWFYLSPSVTLHHIFIIYLSSFCSLLLSNGCDVKGHGQLCFSLGADNYAKMMFAGRPTSLKSVNEKNKTKKKQNRPSWVKCSLLCAPHKWEHIWRPLWHCPAKLLSSSPSWHYAPGNSCVWLWYTVKQLQASVLPVKQTG